MRPALTGLRSAEKSRSADREKRYRGKATSKIKRFNVSPINNQLALGLMKWESDPH